MMLSLAVAQQSPLKSVCCPAMAPLATVHSHPASPLHYALCITVYCLNYCNGGPEDQKTMGSQREIPLTRRLKA